MSKRAATARAEEPLDRFDLLDAADRLMKTYSGGMRRRLDLAASLVATPTVIANDTPRTLKSSVGGEQIKLILQRATDLPVAQELLYQVIRSAPAVTAESLQLAAPATNIDVALPLAVWKYRR